MCLSCVLCKVASSIVIDMINPQISQDFSNKSSYLKRVLGWERVLNLQKIATFDGMCPVSS